MTTTINVAALLARLRQHQAALGDIRDCTSDREKADHFAATRDCAQVISGLMNSPQDVARQQVRLDDLETRRAAVVAKEAEIEQEITSAPDWQRIEDGRQRDQEHDRQQSLHRRLQMLRAGTLLCAPGTTYERLEDLDRRIAEVRDRRDRAQAALDSAVTEAEALLAAATVTT
jgi:hypothetical protein